MKLYTIKSEGLAHNSYMLTDNQEAVVIDPRRDCRIYKRIANNSCTKIRYILETHRNEDYIVGSTELKALTGAEIGHSKQLAFTYGDHNFDDEETLKVGNLKIKTLQTPGHTDESLCYTVTEAEKTTRPMLVFTGDTLFVGSIGRTDLQGKGAQKKQAEKLFTSLHEKLLSLEDSVLVYPAHGAGSVCGSEISEQSFSTIGYERQTNPFLKIGKEEFVKKAVAQEMIKPAYFAKIEEYNLHGAPFLKGVAKPKQLSVNEFEAEMQKTDTTIVDTRAPYAFGGSHVPSALSIWLGEGTSVYTGWILGYDQRILLVVESKRDVRRVMKHFWRLGFDNVCGFLCPGIKKWQEEGKPIKHVQTLPVSELKEKLDHYVVLDVREPSERHEEGVIEGAKEIFFADLPQKAENLDRNKHYAVTCSVGNRASTAASILERKGFDYINNVLGGMTAWQKLGYPTAKSKA
ncbi:MAG TPA: MBL fold metallo-hydrolase [Candidatus Nanoarchaeia archaeon]|nr:MBL fold metallo-hydrolase [Candidatus Nanoarchaeia archaeon]